MTVAIRLLLLHIYTVYNHYLYKIFARRFILSTKHSDNLYKQAIFYRFFFLTNMSSFETKQLFSKYIMNTYLN